MILPHPTIRTEHKLSIVEMRVKSSKIQLEQLA
jgi:hypothetical protein